MIAAGAPGCHAVTQINHLSSVALQPWLAVHTLARRAIDQDRREVVVDGGARVGYDYLLLASGVTTSLEHLATQNGTGDLTVVVVGGGTTGVETAGALAELRNAGVKAAFPEIIPRRVNVVLIEQGPELLAPYPPRLRRYTLTQLRKRAVEVLLDTSVREVTPDTVTLGDHTTLRADLTIWAAGVTASTGVRDWGLPQGRGGRILVDDHLRVAGHPEIFAAGDLALIDGAPLPQQAQPAIQTGTHAGQQIAELALLRLAVRQRRHRRRPPRPG